MTQTTKPEDPEVQRAAILFQLGIIMGEVSGKPSFSNSITGAILDAIGGKKKGHAWCRAALEHVDNIKRVSFSQDQGTSHWVTVVEWKDKA